MNTKNIPPLITACAGLVATISMYIRHYELHILLGVLLAVLIIFYILGLLVKKMFDTFGMQMEKAKEQDENAENETTFSENQDGAVIEKQ